MQASWDRKELECLGRGQGSAKTESTAFHQYRMVNEYDICPESSLFLFYSFSESDLNSCSVVCVCGMM